MLLSSVWLLLKDDCEQLMSVPLPRNLELPPRVRDMSRVTHTCPGFVAAQMAVKAVCMGDVKTRSEGVQDRSTREAWFQTARIQASARVVAPRLQKVSWHRSKHLRYGSYVLIYTSMGAYVLHQKITS